MFQKQGAILILITLSQARAFAVQNYDLIFKECKFLAASNNNDGIVLRSSEKLENIKCKDTQKDTVCTFSSFIQNI